MICLPSIQPAMPKPHEMGGDWRLERNPKTGLYKLVSHEDSAVRFHKSIKMRANTAVPPVIMQGPAVKASNGQQMVPFRRATVERVLTLPSFTGNLTAAYQPILYTVDGTGYVYRIRLRAVATTGANSANVAFAEDGPWNVLGLVTFADPNGQLVNVPSGWYLYLSQLIQKQYVGRNVDLSSFSNTGTAGTGANGGAFTIFFDIPIGLNRRNLKGILGNQDRAIKYTLETDLNAQSVIYSVAPNGGNPAITLERYYEYYSVPLQTGPQGTAQQSIPADYGTLHFTTVTLNASAPVGGSSVNHMLVRVGNTVRAIALVFRLNGSRANVETAANQPTLLTFKGGDDTLFTETWAYRKAEMFMRFGFDFPNGVLCYETMHDFDGQGVGGEVGDDYWHTQALVNGQFQIAYPSGFGSTNNTLNILTDDLVYATPTG
jgi:hypothetical protein